ncbi:hypothetical protein ACTXG5_00050 [Mycobacterium sp. Dal123C01]|uniref:hypothetical protein n=1 Tax=Mycobacterium sp. Dal123C01 TaxID=3457577 RepID=UPI00403EC25D
MRDDTATRALPHRINAKIRKEDQAEMTLSLTQAEAEAKISQLEDARGQAIAKLNQIEDSQQLMLGSNWKGGSATTYGHTSATQNEDINQIISNLNQIVQTAETHIRSVANTDNG